MPKRKVAEMEAAGRNGKPPKRLPAVQEDPDEDEEEDAEHSGSEGGSDSDGSSAPEVSSYEEDSSDDDDEDEEGSDEEGADGEKQLTSHFNARAAEEDDFHGLKKLLCNYLAGKDFNCSDLVDTIIKQQAVGMIVTSGEQEEGEQPAAATGSRQNGGTAGASTSAAAGAPADDEDDGRGSIWAVLTVLNTQQHKDKPFMKEVREYAMSLCKDAAGREALGKAWDAQGTGLLVSECVLGLPPKLAPPSLRALTDDLKQATGEGSSKEARRAFKLKQLVLLPMVLVESGAAKGQAAAGAAGGSSSGGGLGPEQIFYMRPEHEFLHRHSSWSQLAHCHKPLRNDGFVEYRLPMVVAADKLAAVQQDLDAEVA